MYSCYKLSAKIYTKYTEIHGLKERMQLILPPYGLRRLLSLKAFQTDFKRAFLPFFIIVIRNVAKSKE